MNLSRVNFIIFLFTYPMLKFLFQKTEFILVKGFYLNFVKKVNCILNFVNSKWSYFINKTEVKVHYFIKVEVNDNFWNRKSNNFFEFQIVANEFLSPVRFPHTRPPIQRDAKENWYVTHLLIDEAWLESPFPNSCDDCGLLVMCTASKISFKFFSFIWFSNNSFWVESVLQKPLNSGGLH